MFYKVLIINVFVIISSLQALEFKNLKSIQADFKQTIINNADQRIIYSGKLFIKEPSRILWKYEEPIIKNVFLINTMVIIDEPELEQAIFTTLNSEVNLLALLKSAKKISNEKYEAEINEVIYTFLIKDNKIDKIVYKDELDNKVSIELFNSVYNEEIKESIFKFVAPSYYDIIRK
ncbi:MAG: cell envelope biogenesis protein LolA [Arcobacter sp.]|nr:MAG: cell envelope biogenesis protein LolA [Arcobacter sp.]